MNELAGAGYFYTLATLSMTFAGFSVIVVALRQIGGKPFSPLQLLFTQLFIEVGLLTALIAMIPPTLAMCGIQAPLLWRVASAVELVVFGPYVAIWVRRRLAAQPDEALPPLAIGFVALMVLGLVIGLGNIIGFPTMPGPTPVAIMILIMLSVVSLAFMRTYSYFVQD